MEELVCNYFDHYFLKINRFCLEKKCFSKRRLVCDLCLKEKHQNHQENCFQLDHIIAIVENELEKLQQLLDTLSLDTFQKELLSKLFSLKNELQNAKNYLLQFDDRENIVFALNVATRCYNDEIEEEIRNFIYEELCFKHTLFDVLDSIYEQTNIDYLMKKLISKGDNLSFAKKCYAALEYYDLALKLTTNRDNIFLILKKKCKNKTIIDDTLLDQCLLSEAEKVLIKLIDIPNFNPLQYIACTIIQRNLQMHINRPQFNFIWDTICCVYKYIDDKRFCKAILLITLGDFSEAYELISKQDRSHSNGLVILKMFCLLRMERLEDAILCVDNQQNPELNYWREVLLIVFDKLVQPINDQPQLKCLSLLCNSMTLARCDNIEAALLDINQLLQIYPNQQLALYIKGMLLIHCGEENEATQTFKKINIDQSNVYQKVFLASILRYQNKTEEFFEIFKTVEKGSIGDDNYQKLISLEKWNELYFSDEKSKQFLAFDILESMVKQSCTIDNSQFTVLKAVTLMQLDKFNEAEKEMDQALTPKSPFRKDQFYLLYIQGCILAKNKKYLLAQSCFEEAIKSCSNFPKVHACQGFVLMKSNHYQKAINEFEIALKLNKCPLSVKYNLGISFYQNQQLYEAWQCFLTIKNYENSSLYLAIILIQNAQYEEAMQILQDDCEEKGYLKSLLEALSLLGLKNYDNALEKINNIAIFEGVIYLCKAFALFCLSQYGEALKSIEKALQIQEEMLEKQQLISLSLTSLILMKLERQDEAQQFFIAIQNRIENEKYIQIFELLKHQQQLEANNEGNEIQGFLLLRNLLTYIVSSIGAMNMSASEEDIELKKSKIDWWLLNVDLFDFGLDLWTLFNFDQNDK